VTNNRKSMPAHLRDHPAQGWHVPGVIVMNDKMSIGETVDQLYLIWAASTTDEYLDRMVYLPLR
jgi:hypothetical protein